LKGKWEEYEKTGTQTIKTTGQAERKSAQKLVGKTKTSPANKSRQVWACVLSGGPRKKERVLGQGGTLTTSSKAIELGGKKLSMGFKGKIKTPRQPAYEQPSHTTLKKGLGHFETDVPSST